MISSDDPNDDTPVCMYCDHQIGFENDAVALLVGSKKKSEKSGRWYFHPEPFDDDAEVKWFHFHCLQQTFDFTNAPDDPDDDRQCMFCGAPLVEELMYYEFQLGKFIVEGADTVFDHHGHKVRGVTKTVRSYSCHDCVFDGLGEGNAEAARYILGMDPTPEPEPIRRLPETRRVPQRTRAAR